MCMGSIPKGTVPPFSLWQTHSHTWRIIPVSKWLVTPIYKPFSPFWKGSHNPRSWGLQRSPWLLTTYVRHGMMTSFFWVFSMYKKNKPSNQHQATKRSWGSNTFQCSRITLRWRPRRVWRGKHQKPMRWVGGEARTNAHFPRHPGEDLLEVRSVFSIGMFGEGSKYLLTRCLEA